MILKKILEEQQKIIQAEIEQIVLLLNYRKVNEKILPPHKKKKKIFKISRQDGETHEFE